jgi:hypothetical protein
MRARKATADTRFEAWYACSRCSCQPKERARGVLGQTMSAARTPEDTQAVSACPGLLHCQPPGCLLDHLVHSAGAYRPALPATPQAVVSLDAALIALACSQLDIVRPRVRLARSVAHLLPLLLHPVLSLGVVVRLVWVLVVKVDDADGYVRHLLEVVVPDGVGHLLQLGDAPELLEDRVPSGTCGCPSGVTQTSFSWSPRRPRSNYNRTVFKKHPISWSRPSLFFFAFFLSIILCSASPYTAGAQSLPLQFETLTVSLWPEYDRPDVLVIYRAQLGVDTALPARLTFRLPGYVETMHAVAVKEDGVLVNVDPNSIELTHQGNDLLFTFPTTSTEIQFEYYDSVILSKQDQTRQFTYTLSVPYAVETAVFEVQHPFRAEDFTLVPEPVDTRTGNDGLRYSRVEVTSLAPDDIVGLFATYRRNTSELSVQSQGSGTTDQPVDGLVTAESASVSSPWGYIASALGGAGVASLWWWWRESRQRAYVRQSRAGRRPPTSQKGGHRRARRKGQEIHKQEDDRRPGPSIAGSAARFCYKCGVALREDADFCHGCGTKRRDVVE